MSAFALKRRHFFAGLGASALMAGHPACANSLGFQTPLLSAWAEWKSAFLNADGRVIDHLQQGASHSESQGYGMALAAFFADLPAFQSMLAWTQAHLQIREGDHLHAWRWLPDQTPHVPDRNNATDGDLFITWALWRASQVFANSSYKEAAARLTKDISDLCLVGIPGHSGALIMLPGLEGFAQENRITINPAYPMPKLLVDLAEAFDLPRLANCAQTSRLICDQLSQSLLPPDWIEISADGLYPALHRPDVFGYEAMRVPLFEVWSGRKDAPAVQQAATLYTQARMADPSAIPTRVLRLTGSVQETSAEPGYQAVAQAVLCSASTAQEADFDARMPRFTAQQNYYPATLHLMALLALSETNRGCLT